ncbi:MULTISPECIES: hypothetical protein [unclassified Okeania]|uniref:hypothetical protein n=1 Tax=unclassified Okeania TaxID=2634635 RepID=UPI0013C146F4|nr:MULTISPECIES: hypothetical protein [unclassified Okeania]NEN92203.1 hypothetical protein [Okeania sp. SIO3H1]NET30288.1 hypothetical protein [Okeania sp. SIO1I7]NET45915.1 hypothetical protein [Okeania sp. SIO2B3]
METLPAGAKYYLFTMIGEDWKGVDFYSSIEEAKKDWEYELEAGEIQEIRPSKLWETRGGRLSDTVYECGARTILQAVDGHIEIFVNLKTDTVRLKRIKYKSAH